MGNPASFDWGTPAPGSDPFGSAPAPIPLQATQPADPFTLVPDAAFAAHSRALEPAAAAPSAMVAATAVMAPKRGQALSTTALALALVASLVLGACTFSALAAIDVVSLDPLAAFLGWATWVVAALVAGFLASVLALVAVFYARPRRIAALALAVAFVLPGLAFVLGFQQGTQVLYRHVQAEVEAGGTAVMETLESSAALHGVDVSFLRSWIED